MEENKKKLFNEDNLNKKKIMQNASLECLKDILLVCNNQNLRILLGGGSALGAVRHNGFIPWDDDIDLNMPRDDFEKFKKIFDEKLGDKYTLYTANYKNHAYTRFAKVEIKNTLLITETNYLNKRKMGISLDIFVIDKIPKSKVVRFLHGIIATTLMFICSNVSFYINKNSLLKNDYISKKTKIIVYYLKLVVGLLFQIVPLYKWYNILDNFLYYKGETNLRGVPTGRKHYFGEIFDKGVYFPSSNGIFENLNVYLPNQVDKYLVNLYGNYMEMPPINKRTSHKILDCRILD